MNSAGVVDAEAFICTLCTWRRSRRYCVLFATTFISRFYQACVCLILCLSYQRFVTAEVV
jgi:hypothetical protein